MNRWFWVIGHCHAKRRQKIIFKIPKDKSKLKQTYGTSAFIISNPCIYCTTTCSIRRRWFLNINHLPFYLVGRRGVFRCGINHILACYHILSIRLHATRISALSTPSHIVTHARNTSFTYYIFCIL